MRALKNAPNDFPARAPTTSTAALASDISICRSRVQFGARRHILQTSEWLRRPQRVQFFLSYEMYLLFPLDVLLTFFLNTKCDFQLMKLTANTHFLRALPQP